MQTPPAAHAFLRPTGRTLFWRTFLPWQFLRFLIINIRMTVMILKSHQTTLPPRPTPPPSN